MNFLFKINKYFGQASQNYEYPIAYYTFLPIIAAAKSSPTFLMYL